MSGTWKVKFLQGGPALPSGFETTQLVLWTQRVDAEAQRFAGTALYSLAFRAPVDRLKPQDNLLEIEVTNVSANRIRDLDRRKVPWKNFHDINFVNLNYRLFDAADWPLYESGLLGPVTLTKMEGMTP